MPHATCCAMTRKFVIRPVKLKRQTATARTRNLALFKAAIARILSGDHRDLYFDATYRACYSLCLSLDADRVYSAIQVALARHCAHEKVFRSELAAKASMLEDVALFMARTWLPLAGASGIMDMAMAIFDSRKARALAHWRRATGRFGRALRALRVLHAQVHFRPGGDGAAAAAKQFEALQSAA